MKLKERLVTQQLVNNEPMAIPVSIKRPQTVLMLATLRPVKS